ncbi:RagB/SusD family nutrient uptake outer membrane protein [Seonamhaeicola sp.]|uniref:RagB/SusD family nutrient uptake outer membrane protein n=1 Tax=Seonamhaeicola sp. TaxID=1912245 RepID=UPI00260C428B|nr:RagB/SusD family nutrient uptake outer membrane protein [Seonamhaeicola sp.]
MKNLKNLKLEYLFALLLFFTVNSCDEDIEIEVTSAFASDLVLSTPEQLELLLLSTYNSTDSWGMNKQNWWGRRFNIEIASFEAKFNFNNLDLARERAGWTAGNAGLFNNKWGQLWTYVREANLFLELAQDSQAMEQDPDAVNQLIAEMRFLRANLYTKLLKYYGGVPILTRTYALDDDFDIPRNTYEECVDFIVSELDAAAALLPETRPDAELGRATSMAALAVKSRTLLYAASDLHDPALAPQTSNKELYTYSNANKWQDAANAAKAVIDMVGGRDLITTPSATAYQSLFLTPNQDMIFVRPYGGSLFDYGTDANTLWDKTQSPRGFDGWGLSTPTHNYVLEYNMADGTTTSDAGYDPLDPYTGREMRFYANINYQGAEFRGRAIDYSLAADTPNAALDGADSESLALDFGNFRHWSRTGYHIRKFQDEGIPITGISAKRPYILYRLAEIYLNYAEAQAELGNDAEARIYLNKVSSRALQPDITAGGTELLEAIKRERRVELAFEGHNFFDERRWMNEPHLGMDIIGLLWTKHPDLSVTSTEYTVATRPWTDSRMYYLPIPQSEIDRSTLVQNDGY